MLDITLTDESIGVTDNAADNTEEYAARYCVRVVIYDSKGRIAMNKWDTWSLKEDFDEFYELPWGWVDEGETEEEAVQRESQEEARCTVKNIRKIGTLAAVKGYNKRTTYSGVYLAEFKTPMADILHSEREKMRKQEPVWVDTLDEALSRVNCAEDKCKNPKGKFITLRDRIVLQYVKDNQLLP